MSKPIFGTTIHSQPGLAFINEAMDIITSKLAEKEGIYRFSPNLTDLVSIQHKLNHGETVNLQSLDVNMLTGLVKCYFRELEPEPLIPFDSYESLIAAVQEEHYKILIAGVLDEVSYESATMLAKLCHHLHYLSTKSEKNKMPSENLAIVWAQNLLRPRVETPATILGDVLYVNDLVGKLIDEADYFFSEELMQKRKAEWDYMQANPEVMKKKEEEKKRKKREKEVEKEREKAKESSGDEGVGVSVGPGGVETYEVKYKPPKSLTYKQMKLQVSYEGGIKLLEGKSEDVREQYSPDQLRWVSCPVADTVSIDFGTNRTLNNGFLIVKTTRAKELEGALSDLRERAKMEETKRRMGAIPSNVKWDADEEMRRRKENKRKINEEWMIDFIAARKPVNLGRADEISVDDRKQLRKSLTVRYAIKKKDNPVRAAIQEMQMKDNKMADFFNHMVTKVKTGNYTLKQLDAWLKWIGSKIFSKGGPTEIPKELLDMEEEELANGGNNNNYNTPLKDGGSGVVRGGGGGGSPLVTAEQLSNRKKHTTNRPIAHSSPVLPTGRSVIVKPPASPPSSSGHLSPPHGQMPMGRSVIMRPKASDDTTTTTTTKPHASTYSGPSSKGGSLIEPSRRALTSDSDHNNNNRPPSPSPPVPPRNRGAVSVYQPSSPTRPPVPARDRKNNDDGGDASASGVSAQNISEGRANLAALTNGRSAFIPRNRNNLTSATGGVSGSPPNSSGGLSAIPTGSKSIRPPAPPRHPKMKLSDN